MKAETIRKKNKGYTKTQSRYVLKLPQTPQYRQIMRKHIMQMKSTSFPSFKYKRQTLHVPNLAETMSLWPLWVILIRNSERFAT
jgi:hypothetical protein